VVICPSITITRTGNVLSVPAGYVAYLWTYNGGAIPGVDQPFLVTQGDGLYTVTVDAGNGCEVTAEFDLNTVGIAEQDAGNGLHIYPNPGRDLFTLDMLGVEGSTAHLEVMEMTGRVVHRERLEVANGRVQAAFMLVVPAGNYLVQVVDQYRVRTERLVVQ
jgi:hypothetical protein